MRQLILIPATLAGVLALSACSQKEKDDEAVERAFQDVNVVDESDLNDVMLTVADPNEAVDYFTRATKAAPGRIELQRGVFDVRIVLRQRLQCGVMCRYYQAGVTPSQFQDDCLTESSTLLRVCSRAQFIKEHQGPLIRATQRVVDA